ncbi:MAG: Spy/CpxP family protein refolding chaperone [Alphaproteobacteria bacterium]|nr:Spy/CpxP family protein refolding chaperone [Alphaproteobacteria bacterium]
MRKALLPMVASLALCGAATAALIATNANAAQTARPLMIALIGGDAGAAQTVRNPVMIAQLAADDRAGPRAEGGPPPDMDRMMDRGARRGQMCQTMYAHKVGELAFLEAKLSLTATQEPLFARWKQTSLDIAKRHESDCSSSERREPGRRRDMMARLDMQETMLKRRLADIGAERPSLGALYAALNPEQKQELGHAGMRGMGGRMSMMGRHHGMGHGPMGPTGRGPMGEAPPPPPPQ